MIKVSAEGFALALRTAMQEARLDEREQIARQVEGLIHDDMPGAYIVVLRQVRDEILNRE